MKFLMTLIILSLATFQLYGANLVKKVTSPNVKISFVDVGQGDAEVIHDLDTNKVVVIDTGVKKSGIVEYLQSEGIKTVDLMILTHPHSDHIGAGVRIIENFTVKKVLDPGFKHGSRTYEKLLQKIKAENIPYVKGVIGQKIKLGKATLNVLAPPRQAITGTRSDANSNSIIFMYTLGNFKTYFAADSEHETEEFVLGNHTNLKADILKVAHHGSRHATSDEFLDQVKPRVAVISAGLNNVYNHPAPKILKQLKDRNIDSYVTFEVGTVVAKANGTSYSIETKKTNSRNAHNSIKNIKNNDPDNYEEVMEAKSKKRKRGKKTFAQLNANGKPILKTGHFYASKSSKKFYAWNCKGVKRVKPSNLLEFTSYAEVTGTNRTLARGCKYSASKDEMQMDTPQPTTKSETKSSNNSGKININTASVGELKSIKGIGKKTAQKIVDYRKISKFKSIEEITKVKGIGKGKFNKIKNFITVN